MGDKIGIMGAGALGSYVGAFLSKIGEDVTFVDMWPEHVEKMRADGLHVTGSQGPFTVPVKAMHLTEAQNISVPFDWVFISVKSYDTEWATHFIKRYVREDGFFVSLQNCWNDVPMGEIVGSNRQLGCIASHIEVALWEPALVTAAARWDGTRATQYFEWVSRTGASRRGPRKSPRCWTISTAPTPQTTFGVSAGPSSPRTPWVTACPPPRVWVPSRWQKTLVAG